MGGVGSGRQGSSGSGLTATEAKGLKVKFELDIQNLKQSLESIKQMVGEQAQSVKKIGDNMSAGFDNANKSAGNLFKTFLGANLSAEVIKNLAVSVLNLGKQMITTAGQFEKYQTSLTVMLGSAKLAKERLKELTDFAASTPLTLAQVVEAGNQLQAVGKYSQETLRNLGDLASASGKPMEQALSAFTKMASGQKGIAVDMFRDLLISVDDWQAATGKGISKNGELLASTDELLNAIPKILKKKGFAGMMEEQSQTFEGVMSNLQDAITNLGGSIGNGFLPVVKEGAKYITSFANSLNEMTKPTNAQNIEKEQFALNALVAQITDSNTTNEDRLKLLQQLKKEYPDFIGNINLEKVTNEDLIKSLAAANEQYVIKLALADQEDKLKDKQKDAKEKLLKYQEAEKKQAEEKSKITVAFYDLELNSIDKKIKKEYESKLLFANSKKEVATVLTDFQKLLNSDEDKRAFNVQMSGLSDLANKYTETKKKLNEYKQSLSESTSLAVEIEKAKKDAGLDKPYVPKTAGSLTKNTVTTSEIIEQPDYAKLAEAAKEYYKNIGIIENEANDVSVRMEASLVNEKLLKDTKYLQEYLKLLDKKEKSTEKSINLEVNLETEALAKKIKDLQMAADKDKEEADKLYNDKKISFEQWAQYYLDRNKKLEIDIADIKKKAAEDEEKRKKEQDEQDKKDKDKRKEALKEYTQYLSEILNKSMVDTSNSYANTINNMISSIDEMVGSIATSGGDIRTILQAVFNAVSDMVSGVFDMINQSMSESLSSSLNELSTQYDALQKKSDDHYAREKELIEYDGLTKKQHLENQLKEAEKTGNKEKIATAKKNLDLYNLDEEQQKKDEALKRKQKQTEYDLKKKAFEQEKASKLAEIWINYAVGVASAWAGAAQWPGVSMIAGLALAGVLTGLLTASAAASTGLVASQSYPAAAFAEGVTNWGGGTALVGEKGPELVTMGSGSNVITNENLQKLFNSVGNAGNQIVQLVTNTYLDNDLICQKVEEFLIGKQQYTEARLF